MSKILKLENAFIIGNKVIDVIKLLDKIRDDFMDLGGEDNDMVISEINHYRGSITISVMVNPTEEERQDQIEAEERHRRTSSDAPQSAPLS